MGFYTDQILPRIVDKVTNRGEFRDLRPRVTGGLDGEVLVPHGAARPDPT